jgi:hypothetical protein
MSRGVVGKLRTVRCTWAAVLLGLASLLASTGLALAQTSPATPVSVVLPEQRYEPGVHDTGPIALPPGTAAREQLVCVLSMGAPVEVTGEMMYSEDSGQTWQEWAPFGMSLGEPTWDTKRNQWAQTPDSCSGSSAADTTAWTHVRLFVNLANAPALLSATVGDAISGDPGSAATADPQDNGGDPPTEVPDETQRPRDMGPD